MRIGVVVPCHGQEEFLPRTLAALERALGGADWTGVVVSPAAPSVPARWRLVGSAGAGAVPPRTPGGARMVGLSACADDWVLFVDADVEVEPGWVGQAVAAAAAAEKPGATLAGIGGRLEEWFVDGAGERPGRTDLLRVGRGARDMDYLTTPVLYRRRALLEVGGYDVRLSSEEDFELGMRLRAGGHTLRSLGVLAGRHWSAPRPSFAELARRWRSGLCFGQGQVLRIYAGRPGFATLLKRQSLYVATLGMWLLDLVALGLGLGSGDARAFGLWIVLPLLALVPMSIRKRSPRLALYSLSSWSLHGLGLVAGLARRLPEAERPTC